MTDGDDPLDGADVGETRTVTRSKTLHGIDMEPREFWGSDRMADRRIADVEVVENSEGEPIDVELTWEADLTKTLPPRWDYCREPRTEEEEANARRKKWLARVAQGIAIALPIGVASALMYGIAPAFENVTINGEAMAVNPASMVTTALLVVGFASVMMWAVRRGLPGKVRIA